MIIKICDCNQGRFPCTCLPDADIAAVIAEDRMNREISEASGLPVVKNFLPMPEVKAPKVDPDLTDVLSRDEARRTFMGCVYRNAQQTPCEIGRFFKRDHAEQKELTTEVVKLMDAAFTVALAESHDLRMRIEELEAEKFALEDQVKELQELMAQEPAPGKYHDVLGPFLGMMDKELHANADKGDRPGWLAMSKETALLEIFYHVGKLQKAVKDSDNEGVKEYAADVANLSMMLVDIHSLLTADNDNHSKCSQTLWLKGWGAPRTCEICGMGPCTVDAVADGKARDA